MIDNLNLKPGFYRATVRGMTNVHIMVNYRGNIESVKPVNGFYDHCREHVPYARRLLTIDIGNDVLAASTYIDSLKYATPARHGDEDRLLNIAAQIEEQSGGSDHVPEPGVHGVVVAQGPGHVRQEWHRVTSSQAEGLWRAQSDGFGTQWRFLIEPVVLRDGVS